MDNPGTYSHILSITIAGTQVSSSPTIGLDGSVAVQADLAFAYGSGGTTCDAYVQRSVDGATWLDMAHYQFTTASASRSFNISGLTPVASPVTPTDGALSGSTTVDGLLGPMLRVKAVTVGTYSGSTTLTARLTVR